MIVCSWHLKLSERQYFQISCIFTFDGAFRVLYKMWLPFRSDVFLLSATDSLLKFGSNDFTCSPPFFGLLVDYFSTLNWRWVILLLYFVTTLLILSVAKVSRVSFENDESIDPSTSWSDEFFEFRFSVVRRFFPDFWIRFYQWLYSIFDGIWKAVPCFFVASFHVMMLSCLNWLLFCRFFWRDCIFLSYRSTP